MAADLDRLLRSCAFNPAEVKPAPFDFSKHMTSERSAKKLKKSEGPGTGEDSLPKRVLLSLDSPQLQSWLQAMWFATGASTLFVERFPTEFLAASIGKLILRQ